ncbi:MAG TPA: type II toxin-antitoxin system VapC family toxin [Candidatus Norongarragalinales archaeon]|nr:type II toxin-antitoxin system VapC family toxin [Candidatus Norongarragalinales archaeon]
MIAIDSNVLIYRIIGDEAALNPDARKIVQVAKNKFNELYGKHERLAIPLPVLTEFANYLRRKFGTADANAKIGDLIADGNFTIVEAKEEFIHMAASIAEEHDADFTDSLIFTIMYANNIKKILTYDKDFEKFPGIEIIK